MKSINYENLNLLNLTGNIAHKYKLVLIQSQLIYLVHMAFNAFKIIRGMGVGGLGRLVQG